MDAPKPPDPQKTAQAQSEYNRATAITQAGLNSTNQVTPWGNLTYEQIGSWEDGTPRFQATQTLSPENKALYDKYTSLAGQLGTMGNNLAVNATQTLSTPFKLGNEEVEGRINELGRKRLDPMWAEREASLEDDLINRGIRPGTPAYESMKRSLGEQRNDSYNQLLLQGRGQASQELSTERNQSINELMALLGGTQVQNPSFTNTPNTPVSGVDYAGLVNNAYNQKVASNNAMMGGIGSLLGTAGSWAMMSDRRVKKDARIVGRLNNGLPVWAFRYKGGQVTMLGVMSDEAREVHPEAVFELEGYDVVDYDKAVL